MERSFANNAQALRRAASRTCRRFAWLPLTWLALGGPALAQSGPGGIPGAGQSLQQLPPRLGEPAAATPKLRVEQAGAAAGAGADAATPIAVQRIELTGHTVFDTATLKALVAQAEGRPQTLLQLETLARRITEYYRANGQPLARAYLPAQTVKDGVVRLTVIEAVYGQVLVNNQSRIGTGQLQAVLAPLQTGQHVSQAPLERSLLLLQELAGVEVSAVARPGADPGSTDLVVSAQDGARLKSSVGLDGQGSQATGRVRASASVDLNNLLGRGDVLSIAALSSGQGLNYGRLGFQMPVNGAGTRAGLGFALLEYRLGDAFSALDAHGNARVLDGFVQQALVRSTSAFLNAEVRLEQKTLMDRVNSTGSNNDRSVDSLTLRLAGELRDEAFGSGATGLSLGYSRGRVQFRDAVAQAWDQSAAGAHTQGRFGRWSASLSRTQALGAASGTSLYASLQAQGASTNLDSSEQISIGGPYGVRGYDVNTLSGAQGYVFTLELRQLLGRSSSAVWQGKVFVDAGHATVYKTPFNALPNSASLRSAGLGLSWNEAAGWNAQLTVARPFGAEPEIAAQRQTRTWLQGGRQF